MKWSLICMAVAGMSVVTAGRSMAADDEDAKLAAFFKRYLDEKFKLQPLAASTEGDHRFDDQLEDLSPKARKAWDEQTRKALQDLEKQIDFKKLTRSGQIDFEILKSHLTRIHWLAENTGSFPVRNGSTTGTIAVGLLPAPAFSPPCSPPMMVVIAQVSYTNVVLTGLAGDTSAEPSLSACLFPGIGIC